MKMKILGNEKIDSVDYFTYPGSIINKYGECSEDIEEQ